MSKVKKPFSACLRVPEHQLLEKRYTINGHFKSGIFDIPGTDTKYFIDLLPNGVGGLGHSYFYLNLKLGEQKEVEAKWNVSIESAGYSQTVANVFKQSDSVYGNFLTTTDELYDPEERFIFNQEMVIKVDGFLMMENDAPVNLCELGEKGNTLGFTLWNQESKDFAIAADGKEVTVHKVVIAAHSPVFAAMFQPHTKEAQENKVVIPDFSFDVVETAIKLCYHYSLVGCISVENKILIFRFFDKYDMQSLKVDLENCLINQIDESNVCELANCSIFANASTLQNKCSEFLQGCLKESKAVSDYDILDKDFCHEMVKNAFRQLS